MLIFDCKEVTNDWTWMWSAYWWIKFGGELRRYSLQLKASMQEPNVLTYCALVVLVTNESSASKCMGHENLVLIGLEMKELQMYQNQTCYKTGFIINDKCHVSGGDIRLCWHIWYLTAHTPSDSSKTLMEKTHQVTKYGVWRIIFQINALAVVTLWYIFGFIASFVESLQRYEISFCFWCNYFRNRAAVAVTWSLTCCMIVGVSLAHTFAEVIH